MSQVTLEEVAREIRAAINEPTFNPQYREVLLAKHRRQMPKLWAALDKLLSLPEDANTIHTP